jgi:hypothetical protein
MEPISVETDGVEVVYFLFQRRYQERKHQSCDCRHPRSTLRASRQIQAVIDPYLVFHAMIFHPPLPQ